MTVASTSEQQTATAASISDASQGRPPMDKIVVAIHGKRDWRKRQGLAHA